MGVFVAWFDEKNTLILVMVVVVGIYGCGSILIGLIIII